MTIHGVLRALEPAHFYEQAVAQARTDAQLGVLAGLDAPVLIGMLEQRRAAGKPAAILVIAPTSRRAEQLELALASYSADAEVVSFPAWETLPHERLSPSPDTVGQRFDAIQAIAKWTGDHPLIVVASVRAALQPVASNLRATDPLTLTVGARGENLETIIAQLVERAYIRVDMVSRRGEFAVRGGILDVFPPTAEHPYRVDFFGDEVDEIRMFAVADQRSLPGKVQQVVLAPARELLLTPAVRARAESLVPKLPGVAGMLVRMAQGIAVDGMESLLPVLADELVPLSSLLPAGSAVALVDPERSAARAQSLADTNREFLNAAWSAATAGADAPVDLDAGDFLTVEQLSESAHERDGAWWEFSAFEADASLASVPELDEGPEADASLDDGPEALPIPSFHGNVEGATSFVAGLLADDWRVVVAASGIGLVERARDVLGERGIAATVVEELIDEPAAGVATLVTAAVESGFQVPSAKLAVLTENEFYGRTIAGDRRVVKKLASRRKNVVDPVQLKPGDFVVHQTHGIGKFVELTQREVVSGGRDKKKTTREYIVLEYAPSKRGYPGDKLHVPTDQLDLLSKYVGGEAPALSKMGGSDWAAAKGRARKAVRDIAVELVKLYSARVSAKGYAFGPDTPWQRELEEAFPFAETPDQLQTIDEIKADMEREIPMDRLLSGDVGFGKTEVAVRAAFKAIQDNKQVAMLVPTTLLVKQHIETFHERFAGFPVKVRGLSRFQTDKEAREVVQGLADGTIDMVIGTHRILTEKVKFKDLGLVIIDEEQRFGVEHKDALKKLKTNVDILAMSATPIPRTLEMAVTGIREMSTLATPPEDRHPILSYVGPKNDKQIIIDRADKYGLSQLHQLRGRVGRGRERAYAYFLYDELAPLSETAADRLQTIAVNNDLGSGMQVALKDLELRGAGNLLGAEQAGHIAGVGFDLYLRMIGEAVATFRGETTNDERELRLEIPVDARIPETYIDSERLRLEAYQKLSSASTAAAGDDHIDLVVEELVDRYGEMPQEVEGLIKIARLRRRAAQAGLTDVVVMGPNLRVTPVSFPDSMQVRLKRLYPKARLLSGDVLLVPLPDDDTDLVAWVGQFLHQMFPLPEASVPAEG